MDESTQAIAEAQAAKDRELMEELSARRELTGLIAEATATEAAKQRRISHAERVQSAQNAAVVAALQQVPLNRAQRRAQTKAFARMLTMVSR